MELTIVREIYGSLPNFLEKFFLIKKKKKANPVDLSSYNGFEILNILPFPSFLGQHEEK